MKTTLNRLQAQKTALLHQDKQIGKAERKARTRTLIQVGALIKMIGLFEYSDITEGMDLQTDMGHRDKAATLLGILIDVYDNLPAKPSLQQLEGWKDAGAQLMKSHQSKKHYQN